MIQHAFGNKKNTPQIRFAFRPCKTVLLVQINCVPSSASFSGKPKSQGHPALTCAVAVVPNPATLLGHLELGAEALALGGRGLEEDGGQLSGAAPLTAGELRSHQPHLLRAVLVGGWGGDTGRAFLSFVRSLGNASDRGPAKTSATLCLSDLKSFKNNASFSVDRAICTPSPPLSQRWTTIQFYAIRIHSKISDQHLIHFKQ